MGENATVSTRMRKLRSAPSQYGKYIVFHLEKFSGKSKEVQQPSKYFKKMAKPKESSNRVLEASEQKICILLLIIIEMRGRANPLYQLAINSISLSKEYTRTQPLASQCQKYDILSTLQRMRFQALGLRPSPSATGIGIRNILIHGSLRITIYYLPQGKVMKLHDHPQMEVVNYVLKGSMQAKMYSHLNEKTYKRETQILQANSIKYIDGFYTKEDNLHQFKALQPTFFLDIIFPDYDDQRPCKFYQEEEHTLDNKESEIFLKEIQYFENDFFQI